MHWLSKALAHGTEHDSSMSPQQLTALQTFLMCCDVQLLHVRPAYQQEAAAVMSESTQHIGDIASHEVLSRSDQNQTLQQPHTGTVAFPGGIEQSQTLPPTDFGKIDGAHADASEAMTAEVHGCLWLHMRMAKRAFGIVSVKGPVMAGRS